MEIDLKTSLHIIKLILRHLHYHGLYRQGKDQLPENETQMMKSTKHINKKRIIFLCSFCQAFFYQK